MRIETDPMGALRAAAVARVEAHYNRLALKNLHQVMVQVVVGGPDQVFAGEILARDAERWSALRAVEATTTPAQLAAAMAPYPRPAESLADGG